MPPYIHVLSQGPQLTFRAFFSLRLCLALAMVSSLLPAEPCRKVKAKHLRGPGKCPDTHPFLGPAPVPGTALSEMGCPAHPARRTTPHGYPNAGQSLGPSVSLGEGVR